MFVDFPAAIVRTAPARPTYMRESLAEIDREPDPKSRSGDKLDENASKASKEYSEIGMMHGPNVLQKPNAPNAPSMQKSLASVVHTAEQACIDAMQAVQLASEERNYRLQSAVGDLRRALDNAASGNQIRSLLEISDLRASELDLCNAFKYVDSENDRALLWEQLIDAFPIRSGDLMSKTEMQQLSNFVLNSAYVRHSAISKKITHLITHFASRSNANQALKCLTVQLRAVQNSTERYEVGKILAGRFASAQLDFRNDLIMSVMKEFKSAGFTKWQFNRIGITIRNLMAASDVHQLTAYKLKWKAAGEKMPPDEDSNPLNAVNNEEKVPADAASEQETSYEGTSALILDQFTRHSTNKTTHGVPISTSVRPEHLPQIKTSPSSKKKAGEIDSATDTVANSSQMRLADLFEANILNSILKKIEISDLGLGSLYRSSKEAYQNEIIGEYGRASLCARSFNKSNRNVASDIARMNEAVIEIDSLPTRLRILALNEINKHSSIISPEAYAIVHDEICMHVVPSNSPHYNDYLNLRMSSAMVLIDANRDIAIFREISNINTLSEENVLRRLDLSRLVNTLARALPLAMRGGDGIVLDQMLHLANLVQSEEKDRLVFPLLEAAKNIADSRHVLQLMTVLFDALPCYLKKHSMRRDKNLISTLNKIYSRIRRVHFRERLTCFDVVASQLSQIAERDVLTIAIKNHIEFSGKHLTPEYIMSVIRRNFSLIDECGLNRNHRLLYQNARLFSHVDVLNQANNCLPLAALLPVINQNGLATGETVADQIRKLKAESSHLEIPLSDHAAFFKILASYFKSNADMEL